MRKTRLRLRSRLRRIKESYSRILLVLSEVIQETQEELSYLKEADLVETEIIFPAASLFRLNFVFTDQGAVPQRRQDHIRE